MIKVKLMRWMHNKKRLIGLTYHHPLILIGQTVRKARITTKLPLAIDMWH